MQTSTTLHTIVLKNLKGDARYADVVRDMRRNRQWNWTTLRQHLEAAAQQCDDLLDLSRATTWQREPYRHRPYDNRNPNIRHPYGRPFRARLANQARDTSGQTNHSHDDHDTDSEYESDVNPEQVTERAQSGRTLTREAGRGPNPTTRHQMGLEIRKDINCTSYLLTGKCEREATCWYAHRTKEQALALLNKEPKKGHQRNAKQSQPDMSERVQIKKQAQRGPATSHVRKPCYQWEAS